MPVLLQLSAVECGAACLAMMLSYFGRKTTVAECRLQCGAGRDGTTARTLAAAARAHGLEVRAFTIEPDAFAQLPLPAIVHWNFNHFLIVEHWSPSAIEIVDPALGRQRLTAEEFDAGFTGVVLTFAPSASFVTERGTSQPSWRRYVPSILRVPGVLGLLSQVVGASLILQLFGLILPLFTKIVVDTVLPLGNANVLPILGIAVLVFVLAQAVCGYLRSVSLLSLQAKLDARMQLGFFAHLFALPFSFFQQRSSGDLMLRLGDATVIRNTLTSQTLSAILDGALVLGYLIILLLQAPSFALLVAGIGVLQGTLLLGTASRMRWLAQQELTAQAGSQSYLVEALMAVATLKASGIEDRALDHWSNLFLQTLYASLRRSHLSAIVDSALTTLRTFCPLVLLWFGTLQVLGGQMSLGTMLALSALAAAFLLPLASLVSNGQQLQLVGPHVARLADVFGSSPEQEPEAAQPAPPLSGRVELQHVSFRFDVHGPMVLSDVSLTIEAGQKVALVGRTGAGKSTLALLLLGLHAPTAGAVLYDGIPLQHLNYRSVRRQFGVVLQEPVLFSGSLRENITLSDAGLTLDSVIESARVAAIDEEIARMPMGYETRVGEGGSGLSGGQRQRVAIARAVASRPAMLLLDEATSHLDVITEALVDQRLSRLSCTRIVIAHRMSTIRNADLILVLDDGRIVEQGAHAELLARRGAYAALVDGQVKESEL